MKSQLKMQARVIQMPIPDPSGPLDAIALFNDDGTLYLPEGGIGPQGPPGDSGPSGATGPIGPQGSAVKRYYGEGPPGTIIGSSPGDEYVDSTTGNLYVLQ